MIVFYRISDKSYPKLKLPGANKMVCFKNFIHEFKGEDIRVIADGCNENTLKFLKTYSKDIHLEEYENLGNAGALKKAVIWASIENHEEIVYLAEDDYLYQEGAKEALLEGFKYGDYVTVFDHPDKYMPEYQFGEQGTVYKTKSSHWKTSISTTMTFATRVLTLREDMEIWEKFIDGQHPHDHQIFTALKEKGRKLIVSLPGKACHVDLTYSAASANTTSFALLGCDKEIYIENWAIENMIALLELGVSDKIKILLQQRAKSRFEYLLTLDAFSKK